MLLVPLLATVSLRHSPLPLWYLAHNPLQAPRTLHCTIPSLVHCPFFYPGAYAILYLSLPETCSKTFLLYDVRCAMLLSPRVRLWCSLLKLWHRCSIAARHIFTLAFVRPDHFMSDALLDSTIWNVAPRLRISKSFTRGHFYLCTSKSH